MLTNHFYSPYLVSAYIFTTFAISLSANAENLCYSDVKGELHCSCIAQCDSGKVNENDTSQIAIAEIETYAPVAHQHDSWTYRQTGDKRPLTCTILSVDASSIREECVQGGNHPEYLVYTDYDLQWNISTYNYGSRRSIMRGYNPARADYQFPLIAGKSWKQTFHFSADSEALSKKESTRHISAKVIGWEKVAVPAGKFMALRVERRVVIPFERSTYIETIWLAPEVGRYVKKASYDINNEKKVFIEELSSYMLAK